MDRLPIELLDNIFRILAEDNKDDKNVLLPPRFVCKAFNNSIQPIVLNTVQLDFVRLANPQHHPSLSALKDVGFMCKALYVDVSIVRDEDEMKRWGQLFGMLDEVRIFMTCPLKKRKESPIQSPKELYASWSLPMASDLGSAVRNDTKITEFLDDFGHFCMGDEGFNEYVYWQLLSDVLQRIPNLQKVRLNLPVLMLLGRGSSAATILLATFLACLASRPEEFASIETLVLDHVSERSIRSICRNPMDLENACHVFQSLKNLAISIKRTSTNPVDTINHFGKDFWLLLSYATELETLSIKGCRTRKSYPSQRVNLWSHEGALWTLHALPFEDLKPHQNLRCLELKNVAVWPKQLIGLLEQHRHTLKELYLVDVFLKINRTDNEENSVLWIGHEESVLKPANSTWIAESILLMDGLKLEVLRATDIGYDVYDPLVAADVAIEYFDLIDPSDQGKPFDRRFVEAAFGLRQAEASIQSLHSQVPRPGLGVPESIKKPDIICDELADPTSYDVSEYRKISRNTTSEWQYSIDGMFRNHSKGTEQKMRELISITEHCFQTVSADVSRLQSMESLPQPTT